MKEKILEALGYTFKYDPSVQKKFLDILLIRYDKDADLLKQFNTVFSENMNLETILDREELRNEMRHLNLMNLGERLKFIKENNIPETVVIAYLKALNEEFTHSSSLREPAAELVNAEKIMLDHLLNDAHLNDELTGFDGISNTNIRLVLQTWLLYPEYLTNPEILDELLECLSVTSCKL